MAARYIPRLMRNYSTPKAPKSLWVKHNGNQPIKVPVKGCADMDDFAKKVRQELATNCQVALFTSLDKQPLRPGLKIADLLKTDLASNSDETPLFLKLSPVVQDPVVTKIIYVGETDDDGVFTGRYKRRILRNDYDLQKVIKNADGLIHPSSPDDVLVSFDDIQDGEKYLFDSVAQNF